MNWKQFKDAVEANGITDEMEMDHISVIGYDSTDNLLIELDQYSRFSVC